MPKLILLNGPIGCGKTDVVNYLKEHYLLTDRRCKDKLFKLTKELFCVDSRTFWNIYNTRELKEVPHEAFKLTYTEAKKLYEHLGKCPPKLCSWVNISIREAMIYVSEIICKPAFGKDYFGIARVKDMTLGELAIDDSCGFAEELPPAVEKLGQENIILIRIHGRGTFEGDSRSYIKDGVIDNTVDVYNTGSLGEYFKTILKIVEDFINGKTSSSD